QRLDGGWVYRQDRVRFTHNSNPDGSRNGDQGIIERIGLEGMTVRLDRTKQTFGIERTIRVDVPHKRYGDLKLGYALSAFEAQNASAKMAFVLTAADPVNHSVLPKQVSRAAEETRVFAARKSVAEAV